MIATSLPDDPWSALGVWAPDPLTVLALLAVGSAYVVGLVRARRAGRAFPTSRLVAFAGGWVTAAVALCSPIDVYADASFAAHMLQHLLLTLVAPPLLALGAPISLALAALPPARARSLAAAMRSPLARVLGNPVVGWCLFVGVPIAVHASRIFDLALSSGGWHAFEHAIWVGAALVYWWPIVGVDPSPHPVPYGVRLLSLLLAMPAMSFLALGIYSAEAPLYAMYASTPVPWGTALTDQRDAAVMMWIGGNLGLVVAMLLVAASWKRHEDEAQRRLEAREDALAASAAG